MPQELMLAYTGFCGQVHLPMRTLPHREEKRGPLRPVLPRHMQGGWIIQYLHPHVQERVSSRPQAAAHASVLLAGMVWYSGPFSNFVTSLAEALIEGRYAALPSGEYCGCVVSEENIWFFQTRASNETLFYTHDQGCLRWSTNPRQIVTAVHLDEEALAWCCTGKDTFVYRGVESVAAGTVVHITARSIQRSVFEQIVPLDLPRRVTLQDLATCCSEALREATRSLAATQRKIGVLLSGGIDSSAIAAALAQHGADVLAYHIHVPGAASELEDAQVVCQKLGRSSSLIDESSLAPMTGTRHAVKTAPFFRPRSLHPSPTADLYDVTSFSPQDLALESTIWQPNGIRVTHPYHYVAVQRLAASLPTAYRLLPYRGKKVVKPVLRWAFAESLPPRAVRQRRGPWLSVPHQDYCLQQASYLAQLIGSAISQVVQRGFIDPIQLQRILNDPQMLRTHYKSVIATAMTELYLRQFDDEKSCAF